MTTSPRHERVGHDILHVSTVVRIACSAALWIGSGMGLRDDMLQPAFDCGATLTPPPPAGAAGHATCYSATGTG